uniref:Uncharacterized protein n=1 Tax=Pseudomonas aeruginosa TaxID=287 RepID=B3G1R7_PSEAI|nr:hypothetical protein PACL_0191 [Pseudomonas aeruginosa]
MASITWVVTVRVTGRESYLGVEPPRLRRDLSGFWAHSAASAALAPTGLRLWTIFVKQSDFRWLAPVGKTTLRWTSVVFHRRLLCQSLLIRLGPLKRGGFAASFQWTRAEELHVELWVTSQLAWEVVRRATRSSWHCDDLPPDFSTTSNLVESVFRAGDGSEKAFYRRADSRPPQAGGGRCAGEGTVSPTRLQ